MRLVPVPLLFLSCILYSTSAGGAAGGVNVVVPVNCSFPVPFLSLSVFGFDLAVFSSAAGRGGCWLPECWYLGYFSC